MSMALNVPLREFTLVPLALGRLYQVVGIEFSQKPTGRQQRSHARANAILSSSVSAMPAIAGRARNSFVLFARSRRDASAKASNPR